MAVKKRPAFRQGAKIAMVGERGIEPPTSSVSRKRSPTELLTRFYLSLRKYYYTENSIKVKVENTGPDGYSYLNASIGLSLAALRAG